MRVLLDTNVVLDLLLDRQPFAEAAAALFAQIEERRLEGLICATTVTTLHYLATKVVGTKDASRKLRQVISLCEVAPVTRRELESAFDLDFADFEDAVLHQAAELSDAAAIVTRDPKGFAKATLIVLSPMECLQLLK